MRLISSESVMYRIDTEFDIERKLLQDLSLELHSFLHVVGSTKVEYS